MCVITHEVKAASYTRSSVFAERTWPRPFDLKPTFVFVLSLLRPKNMSEDDSADHHINNKGIHQQKRNDHGTTDNQNWLAGERIANSEVDVIKTVLGKINENHAIVRTIRLGPLADKCARLAMKKKKQC